jgi:hypothetical protein
MGTSHRLPKPVSRKQLDNRVTNNRNSTGNVTSHFYIWSALTQQQKYTQKTLQSARYLRPVNTYIPASRKQLDNRVTNNHNSTGNVTSRFYIGFASRQQQKYT